MSGPPRRDSRQILEDRARALARPIGGDRASFGIPMLVFALGRERFAIESRHVFAVFSLLDLVPLPGATAPVVGLTSWRGDVLTVIDLRRLVGGAPAALDDLGRVVVVGDTVPDFGILADSVSEIVSIDPTQLHIVSADRNADAERLLRGVTRDGIHVLDAAALMTRQIDTQFSPDASGASDSPSSNSVR